jgi:hypothetical protein
MTRRAEEPTLSLPGIRADFSQAKVVAVTYPPRDVCLVLEGVLVNGGVVPQVRLTFQAVANREEVHAFLTAKHSRRTKKVRWQRKPLVILGQSHYPLKLPTRLTELRASKATRFSYRDRVFTERYGTPEPLKSGQQLYYFAFSEKRFRGRRAFPIVCARLNLVDGKGKPIGGEASVALASWDSEDHERLVTGFVEALLQGDFAAAYARTSKALRKRVPARSFARWFQRWQEVMASLGQLDRPVRKYLEIGITCDDEEVWSASRSLPSVVAAESCRALVEVFLLRLLECHLCIVEEEGELRVGSFT